MEETKFEPTFKKGDKCIMINCTEALTPKNLNLVQVCESDSILRSSTKKEVVQLEGFEGMFMCKNLKKVKVKVRKSKL